MGFFFLLVLRLGRERASRGGEDGRKRSMQPARGADLEGGYLISSSGMPRANLRVDVVELEVDSSVYVGEEMNVRCSLQPQIACRRTSKWRRLYDIIDVSKVSSCDIRKENVVTGEGSENMLMVTERVREQRVLECPFVTISAVKVSVRFVV